MLQLNKDYANLSNSQYAVAANTGIQFVLAKSDTLGNALAEPGIDRINRSAKGWTDYAAAGWTTSYIDANVKPKSIWRPDDYFNVWIIPSIINGSSTLLGYASFPESSTLPGGMVTEADSVVGVVIQTGSVGSSFAPSFCGNSYGAGKTLTHETGHFLGLRHIWGDANCGNDFCGDTPVHFTSNSGVPSHPKSNSCGTPDEMFENYMDYSDDIVLNTFTSNQVDRMQTVMLNSPRRGSLATSPAGGVAVTASNKISFINCTEALQITETGTTLTYPRYKDVSLTLNAEDKASGAATVSVSVTGTAVNNYHYQLLTPSLSFTAGDNFKDIKIRIFDNAEVDGNKTLIVSYTISGTGVTAGTDAQTVTINVSDDDNIKFGTNTITLLNENFGTTGTPLGAGWISGSFKTPAGRNKWTLGSNGGAGITGQALYITSNTTTKPLDYNTDSISDAVVITPSVSTSGYKNPALSFTYKCNGEKDAQGTYDFGELMYTYNGSSYSPLTNNGGSVLTFQGDSVAVSTGSIALPDVLLDTSFRIGFRWINDDNTGRNPPFLIDDILLTATPYPVETAVGSSYSYDVQSGSSTNNFTSMVNRAAIASLKNVSTNLSGVIAQVTQAGNSTASLVTTGGLYVRTQKVFQISPASPNTTATYQASFYFTEAELAIWGANKLTLKILKVKDGVSLASTLNAGNAELITPTVFEDAAAGYITYTGNFTGFSQFVLVSPATTLPVMLTDFTAKAADKNILLSWTTAMGSKQPRLCC